MYLRELIDEKELSPKEVMGLARKNELACCESGPRVTAATRRFFLTMQLTAKAATQVVVSPRAATANCFPQGHIIRRQIHIKDSIPFWGIVFFELGQTDLW